MTSSKPVLTVVAGPNGSGKSTLVRQLIREGYELRNFVNADELGGALRQVLTARAHDFTDDLFDVLGFENARMVREHLLSLRLPLSFETVFSHPSKVDLLE